MQLVHNTLISANLRSRISIGAAGKIVSVFDLVWLMALGCGQAQSCHTDKCPAGVTTQDPQRQQALVVANKAERVLNFPRGTPHALQ